MIRRLRNRSPAELLFRLRQESVNFLYWLKPPQPRFPRPAAPLAGLPGVEEQLKAARRLQSGAAILQQAERILAGRYSLLGFEEVHLGSTPEWGRDWVNGTCAPARYQRLVPFLDFAAAGDHKVIWELNRHQHFVLLAQAWRLSGRSEFLGELRRQWLDWIRRNPFERGINWTSALEAGLRALSWLWALHLCGPELAGPEILTSLGQHAIFIENNLSIYFSPNTHLLGEAVALYALGAALPENRRAERWRRLADDLVWAQLERQVRSDGAHFEQSSWYHLYALDMFLFHYLQTGRPAAMRERLVRMAEFLDAVMGPEGRLPLVGDDDGGRFFHPYGIRENFGRGTLAACAILFDRPEWLTGAEDLGDLAAWWLGPEACCGPAPARAPSGFRVFPESGITIFNQNPWWVLFDAGPFGPFSAGHSHADTLSLVVRSGGEDLLIDPGTYTYTAGRAWRDYFRGTAAHNTVRVDGCDQARAAGPFAWEGRPETRLEEARPELAQAWCAYGIPGGRLLHRRTVQPSGERLIITDELDGPPGEHLLEQFWHCGVPVVAINERRFRLGAAAILETGEDAVLEQGWRSAAYGQKQASPVVVVRRKGRLPWRVQCVLRVSY